ncbi:MAG: hypothetical protein AAFW95_15610, partial [Cyanobacteria bacterium J06638_6]
RDLLKPLFDAGQALPVRLTGEAVVDAGHDLGAQVIGYGHHLVAMLDAGKPGVRDHVEIASQVMAVADDLRTEVMASIDDGLARKPDWKSLARVKQWLE